MKLSETLSITEAKNGFWLYDKTRCMNLSMGAKTAEQAFVEALTYYQKRTTALETELKTLRTAIDSFVAIVRPEAED